MHLDDERGKMIPSSRGKGLQAKQEGDSTNDNKLSKASSSSRQWSDFRNPRIVRVSRSFGGKDRHSKVCTIRGLRDRRIRLSVPTAIQLYDLQDRLGLSQPSKVIDWLLDNTKGDIDKLPPLQIPPGFGQFYQQTLASHASNASQSSFSPFFDANLTILKDGATHSSLYSKEGLKINNNLEGDQEYQTLMAKSKYWDIDMALRAKSKEAEGQSVAEKAKWIKLNEQDQNQDGIGGNNGQVSAQNLFPIAGHSSIPGLLNNAMPYNYYHWEPPNSSLSQFGSHGFLSQTENPLNNNAASLPAASLALPSGSQFFFCPPTTTPSLFPPYPPYVTTPLESDPRQINHFQFLSSSSQHVPSNSLTSNLPMRSFSLNVNSKLLPSQNNNEKPSREG